MIVERPAAKKRVKSVFTSLTKEEKSKGGNTKRTVSSIKGQPKKDKRICSSKGRTADKNRQIVNQKMPDCESKQKERVSVVVERDDFQSKHHFMTVADLSSGDFVEGNDRDKLETPINDYNQDSTIKTLKTGGKQSKIHEISLVQMNPANEMSIIQREKELDGTIGKLKQKQQTIDLLSKTIQTRLIQASANRYSSSNRMDVYEVEMNYYVERISQLQRELHEKNKILSSMAEKHAEFNTVTKNNKRLIGENHRLREERNLLDRENQALKRLLINKLPKSK